MHSRDVGFSFALNPIQVYTLTQLGIQLMNYSSKTIAWYLKWSSSIALIIGMALTSANFYPLNMYFQLSGIVGWLVVGLLWHDRSLIVLNTVGASIFISGIISSLF